MSSLFMPALPFGIGRPNVLVIPVTSTAASLDLTTVSAVALDVRRPDGAHWGGAFVEDFVADWAATIQTGGSYNGTPWLGTTSQLLLVNYAFQGMEFEPPNDVEGAWRFAPLLTVSGGVVPCPHVTRWVRAGP